jgi:hypothetical protein
MDAVSPAWLSLNDYRALTLALAGEIDPRILIVTGFVTARGTGHIESALGVDEGTVDRSEPGQSPFAIVVRDAAGATLGAYGVIPPPPSGIFQDIQPDVDEDGVGDDGLCDGDADHNWIPDCFAVPHAGSCPDTLRFSLAVPWLPGGTQVTLSGPVPGAVYPDCPPEVADAPPLAELETVAVSEDAIPIELLEPIGELDVEPGEAVVVHWRLGGGKPGMAGEPPPHGVMIAASYDGGQTWWPRAVGVQGDVYTLPNTGLAHAVRMRVKVFSLQNGLIGSSTGSPTEVPGLTPAAGSSTVLSLASELPRDPRGPIVFVAKFPSALAGSDYRLTVYDVRGRLVTDLARGVVSQELLRVGWDGRDAGGRRLAAGIYMCRLDAGAEKRTVKVVRVW